MQSGPIIVPRPILMVPDRAVSDPPFIPTSFSMIILAEAKNVLNRTGPLKPAALARHEDETRMTLSPITISPRGERMMGIP